jgi:hypothetical protein
MEPDISDLRPLTYSMLINNNVDKTIRLNLENIVKNLKLTFEYKPPDWIPYGNLPGFVSKSYYQSKPETGYNYPPKGPIDKYFKCVYCKNTGTDFHAINCKRPFESSLILTQEGSSQYNRDVGTSYVLIVKKPGQKKLIKGIKGEKFTDNVELVYQNKDTTKCVVRIAKNGSINIISSSKESLPKEIIKDINETPGALIDQPLTINPESSYKYQISAQFNIFNESLKDKLFVNLNILNDSLTEFKKNVNGQTVFMVGNVTNRYNLSDYVYNSGDITSKTNKTTNPYIKFYLINPSDESFKINVMIYKRGAVQLRGSYNKTSKEFPLEFDLLENVYIFLKGLFEEITEQFITKDPNTPVSKKITNMVDGSQPEMCHDRKGREVRPKPYSFYGKCPMPDYFVKPFGVKNSKGKYEPCCYKLNKSGEDSEDRYNSILINGYPDGLFGELVPDPDNLSAVYAPGTKKQESRRFKGLKDLGKKDLVNCIKDSGYIEENVFTKQSNDYVSLKKEVLGKYSKRASFYKNTNLSRSNFMDFTRFNYIVVPIIQGTIKVLLFFDSDGTSYFINNNSDVSESGVPPISKLANTVIEGYLSPYEEPDFIFYPTDIHFFRDKDVSSKEYYSSSSKDTRYNFLRNALDSINQGSLTIIMNFSDDLVNGTKYYLSNLNEAGILFKNYSGKKDLIWYDNSVPDNLIISLNVTKKIKNRWEVSINSKNLPTSLLPQKDNTVEISVKFTDDNKIKDSGIILFEILLNRIDNKINTGKPLNPIGVLESNINDYSEVVSILQSISFPIKKETFLTGNGFLLDSVNYISDSVSEPLKINEN